MRLSRENLLIAELVPYTVFRMAKRRDENISDETLSTRLTVDEKARWQDVFRIAQRNADGVKRYDVIRFLLGLPVREEIASDFLSASDRIYFQTGQRVEDSGRSKNAGNVFRNITTREGRRGRNKRTGSDKK
jgi:hypothetical protein